ncbi:ankyrin repeat domain-containing protein [Kistimonas asteriae]|uniref:ankyrin repeat domain-containing protein n=1 Tax=Kistimonas asteriae TaxID=517724 RepID=UPI001BA5D1F1|nr:ankyrin repeat domain-containing protein [Kistimonas asteriae]
MEGLPRTTATTATTATGHLAAGISAAELESSVFSDEDIYGQIHALLIGDRTVEPVEIESLLTHYSDINTMNEDNSTLLNVAATHGQSAVVGLLIEKGADMELADKNLCTPLHNAAIYGNTDAVNLLFFYDANIESEGKYGHSPLGNSALNSQPKSVDLLIKFGVRTDHLDHGRNTALHLAASSRDTDSVRLLLNANPDMIHKLNEFLRTPLHNAANAYSGCAGAVPILIAAGSKINLRDCDGKTPVYFASARGHSEAVSHLVTAGADVNVASQRYKSSPLCEAATWGYSDIVRTLVDAKADVTFTDYEGRQALHCAARGCSLGSEDRREFDYEETVKLLADAGAAVNESDSRGMAPLHIAAYENNLAAFKGLVESLANVNQAITPGSIDTYRDFSVIKKSAPLHYAAQQGNLEVVKRLLEEGANIDKTDGGERTPLYFAIGRRPQIAHFLMDAGANIEQVEHLGRSLLLVAIMDLRATLEGYTDSDAEALKEIIRRMIRSGADLDKIVPGSRYSSPRAMLEEIFANDEQQYRSFIDLKPVEPYKRGWHSCFSLQSQISHVVRGALHKRLDIDQLPIAPSLQQFVRSRCITDTSASSSDSVSQPLIVINQENQAS